MNADRWSDELLDRMRREGDPVADATVAEIFRKGEVAAVNALLIQLIHNDDPPPSTLDPVVRDYFDHTSALPPWAAPE